MEYIVYALKGILIGLACAVPGLDGGTIALVTKIYDKLVDSITLNLKKLFKALPFLISVFIGVATGIFLSAKVLAYLFHNYNTPTQFFFIGIIIGSFPNIYKECTKDSKLKPVHIIPFLIGLSVIVALGIFMSGRSSSSQEMHPAVLFLISVIGAISLVVPGFSGALIMKVLGAYEIAINALNSFDIFTMAVIGLGVITGIFIAARVMSFLLNKWRTVTYCILGGLVLGSIPTIYPKDFRFDSSAVIPIIFLIVGLILPTASNMLGKVNNKNK